MSRPLPLSAHFGILMVISLFAGIPLTLIHWGNPDHFHGQGFPIASVMWDKDPDSGRMLDYPNPYAIILNPLILFITGAILMTPIWMLSRRRSRTHKVT